MLALLATVLVDSIGRYCFPILYAAATGDSLLDQNFKQMAFSRESVGPALLMLPGSFGMHFGTNGPLWSRAYEVVCYAAYPLWLWSRRLIGVWAYVIGCGLAAGVALAVSQPFIHDVLLLYPLWLAGAALAEYMVRQNAHTSRLHIAAILAVLGFVGFHVALGPYLLVAYLPFGVGVVLLAVGFPQSVLRWHVHRAFEWLGLQSYTIYICHFPFLALLSAGTFEVLGGRPSYGWMAGGGVIVALAWCHALWWLGERRFIHARLKISTQ